jgi:TPR repeat protein
MCKLPRRRSTRPWIICASALALACFHGSTEPPAPSPARAPTGESSVTCSCQDDSSCFAAGVEHDSPEVTPPDYALAACYYQRACDLDNPTGCDNLGLMYAKGEGVPQDLSRAFMLYRKGCQRDYPMACFHVARAYELGSGIARHAANAVNYYAQVCESSLRLAAATACFNLGMMNLQGLGIPAAPARGVPLLEKACTLGQAAACTALGVAISSGLDGSTPDPGRAATLFEQGCERGSQDGCYNLALAYHHGKGVPPDDSRAELLFAKACRLGVKEACTPRAAP